MLYLAFFVDYFFKFWTENHVVLFKQLDEKNLQVVSAFIEIVRKCNSEVDSFIRNSGVVGSGVIATQCILQVIKFLAFDGTSVTVGDIKILIHIAIYFHSFCITVWVCDFGKRKLKVSVEVKHPRK